MARPTMWIVIIQLMIITTMMPVMTIMITIGTRMIMIMVKVKKNHKYNRDEIMIAIRTANLTTLFTIL